MNKKAKSKFNQKKEIGVKEVKDGDMTIVEAAVEIISYT